MRYLKELSEYGCVFLFYLVASKEIKNLIKFVFVFASTVSGISV